jgi:4a-hydroxytetrahydrobiopterin dehydratase
MNDLVKQECKACNRDSSPLSEQEIGELLPQVPQWRVVMVDAIPRLERVFRFGNFAEALEFTARTGQIAEQANHHPSILTEWGRVKVTWWTHAIRGLHRNDFIMAARTDSLLAG